MAGPQPPMPMGPSPLNAEGDFPITMSQQLAPLVVPYVLLTVATVFVALRLAARRMRQVGIGADDWLCLVALIISWPYQASNTYAIVNGVAEPTLLVFTEDPSGFVALVKAIFSSNILWATTVSILQVSILFFYLRLFGVKRWLRFSAYFMITIVSLYWVSTFIAQLLTCQPLAKFWNPTLQGKCFNQVAFCSATGIIHVILDLIIVFLPIPLIWNLKVSWRTKLLLTGVLAVGVFASITSLLKLTCSINYSFLNLQDETGSIWFSILMQAIEIPLGIICTCIPTLAPVWIATKDSRFGQSARRLITSLTGGSASRTSRGSGGSRGVVGTAEDTTAVGSAGNSGGFNGKKDFQRLDESYVSNTNRSRSTKRSIQSDDIPLADYPTTSARNTSNIQVEHSYTVER